MFQNSHNFVSVKKVEIYVKNVKKNSIKYHVLKKKKGKFNIN